MRIHEILFEKAPSTVDTKAFVSALKSHSDLKPIFSRGYKPRNEDRDAIYSAARRIILGNHDLLRFLNAHYIRTSIFHPRETTLPVSDIVYVIKSCAKVASRSSDGKIPSDIKKALKSFIEHRVKISKSDVERLMTIDGIRPNAPVVLYRGMMFDEYSMAKAAPFAKVIRSGKRSMVLPSGSMSSWTYDKSIAERFARYRANAGNYDGMMSYFSRRENATHIDGTLGIIFKVIARPEDIVVDTTMIDLGYNGGGFLESEVILRPGEKTVQIVAAYNKKGLIDLESFGGDGNQTDIVSKLIDEISGVALVDKADVPNITHDDLYDPKAYLSAKESYQTIVNTFIKMINELQPVIDQLDVRDLDPVAIPEAHHDKIGACRSLKSYMDRISNLNGMEAVAAFNPKGKPSSILDDDKRQIYTNAKRLRGLEPTIGRDERITQYHLMTPGTLEKHLDEYITNYIKVVGGPELETFDERLNKFYSYIRGGKRLLSIIVWLRSVSIHIHTLRGEGNKVSWG